MMATQLKKPVVREIPLTDRFGFSGRAKVVLEPRCDGGWCDLVFRAVGLPRELRVPLERVVEICDRPVNLPARFEANRAGYLLEKQVRDAETARRSKTDG